MTDEVNEQHAGDQWGGDVCAAIAGELRLMDPTVRSARDLARQLLDPDFVEIGASGRRWSCEDMLAALPEMDGAAEDGARYEPEDLRGVVLAPGLVHLTYETTINGERARRSSLWRTGHDGAWRMYYHQATVAPAAGQRRAHERNA
ncbi:nuclear transport factor 2 family protein [Streptomyces sp. NBC_00467]|uniref:nuclear transport factor 2 family protein n=1 Tax=Streptomyces sp. NBC_00467 TaxID=2975752 RepID=UPI002E170F27